MLIFVRYKERKKETETSNTKNTEQYIYGAYECHLNRFKCHVWVVHTIYKYQFILLRYFFFSCSFCMIKISIGNFRFFNFCILTLSLMHLMPHASDFKCAKKYLFIYHIEVRSPDHIPRCVTTLHTYNNSSGRMFK